MLGTVLLLNLISILNVLLYVNNLGAYNGWNASSMCSIANNAYVVKWAGSCMASYPSLCIGIISVMCLKM